MKQKAFANNKMEIYALMENIHNDLSITKDNLEMLNEELLGNYEYGISDDRKYDELLFCRDLISLLIKHFDYFGDNTTKVLDL